MKPTVMVMLAAAIATGCASQPATTAVPPVAHAVVAAPGIVAAGRLSAEDVAGLRAADIRHVIDLTPDAETPGFDEATAVRAAGLRYDNLPLRGAADLTRENVQAFDAMLRAAGRPVLVHCASGNRVGAMAALRAAWVEGRTVEDAIAIGRAWGLKGLEGDVRARLGAEPVERGR